MQLIQPRLNPGIKTFSWDQGSKFKAKMWDQSVENIPLVTTLKYVWFLIYRLKEILKESF